MVYGLRDQENAPTAEEATFFFQTHPLAVHDGCLLLEDLILPQEDCYLCRLYLGEQMVQTLELYALHDDLLGKTPYKGDNHLHTCMTMATTPPCTWLLRPVYAVMITAPSRITS